MASSIFEFYVKIAQIGIIIIILSYFIYRRAKDHIRGFDWFIFLFSAAFIQAITEISIFFPTQNGQLSSNSAIQEVHIIPYAIGLFGLFLYTEYIMYEKPRSILFGIVSALLGSYLAVYFVELAFNLEPNVPPEYRVYRVIFNIFQLIVLADTLLMFIKDVKYVEFKILRRISLYIAIGLGIAVVAALIKVFEQWIRLIIPSFHVYGAITFGILFGILAIEFIANPFYVYLLPTRINKVIVITNSGILLFAVKIGKNAPEIFENTLFSGTVSALKALLAETTGATSDLRKICFKDKNMIIVEDEMRSISTIILSDSDSMMLQVAAKHFTEEFVHSYRDKLAKFDGTVDIFDNAAEIVKKVFPFVPPQDVIIEEQNQHISE